MKITKDINNGVVTLSLEGKLDTITAPELDKALRLELEHAENVVMDFSKLLFVTSAGLRVLLEGHKAAEAKGSSMKLKNVGNDVMEVFEITGLTSVFNFEE